MNSIFDINLCIKLANVAVGERLCTTATSDGVRGVSPMLVECEPKIALRFVIKTNDKSLEFWPN